MNQNYLDKMKKRLNVIIMSGELPSTSVSNSLNIECMEASQVTCNQQLASLLARCPVNHKNISRH